MKHRFSSKVGRVSGADHCRNSDPKHPLEMDDRVVVVLPTHYPSFCASTPQESTEVIGINEDPCLHCQVHHLLWCVGVVELLLNLWVTVYLVAEVIQGIQKRLRVGVHAAGAGETERYSGGSFVST